jgi:hypothetical protein
MGELVGAFAVVVSLVYLSAQIRQNTRAVRSAQFDSIARTNVEILQPMVDDPALAADFERALDEWGDLSLQEQQHLNLLLVQMFRFWENTYYQWRQGMLEPWLWESWQTVMLSHFNRPGARLWWTQRRMAFSKDFGRFLESSPVPTDRIRPFTSRESNAAAVPVRSSEAKRAE